MRRHLRKFRRARERVQHQHIQRVDHAFLRHGVAQAPSGHGERFRKSIDDHGALRHAGQRPDGLVLAAEQNARVNFVGDHPQVVLLRELRNFPECCASLNTVPVGLFGELKISMRVFGVIFAAISAKSG